jgi:NAD(P)-dependent dehydrogenase (short-subunit alcohol dehydrogenase family)
MDWFGGRTAVVTGAARGIGKSAAELLDDLGARVVAVDIDRDALEEAFGGGTVVAFPADVSKDGLKLAADLAAAHGPVELLVNNVGVDSEAHFLDLGERDFDRIFATNLRGPWFLTRGLAQLMLDRAEGGAIVFVSSLHDTFVRSFPHYSASKAAVAMLVKELAVELAPHRIRVNAVSPGAIQTGHVPAPADERERARLRELIPLGGLGQPRQVARMIAVLLCDEWSDYITGANVRVDGGLGLHSWSLHRDAP